ncbi:MAG: putative PEP-binding protein [Coleofasciculaceae cyanobacterium]
MDNLYSLEQINRQEPDFVGHQAFNLSQLLQRGYPVLPGFVVSARTFWQLVEILGESEPLLADLPQSSFHVDVDNPDQLRAVAQRLRQAVMAAEFPLEWAKTLAAAAETLPKSSAVILRPSLSLLSPTAQNASYRLEKRAVFNIEEYPHSLGILDYQICTATPEAMSVALKQVWAELFRAKSLFYWQRAGVGLQELNLAVLIQPLEEAIASGTIRANSLTLEIQATWGQGCAITKGEVIPDSYQVQAATGIVKTRCLGSKNRAYRLKPLDEDHDSLIEVGQTTGCKSALQSYLLSEEQQKLYALEDPYIKQLIQLSGRIATEIGSTFFLEWSLCQTPRSLEPEIYLTYFMPEILPSMPLTSSSLTSTLKGLPAAGGRVMAVAQVFLGERNLETMLPGRILVASSIAPDWLPLLKQAAGIVTERGGMTSHGAIVARELGIPAVVNVADVTKLIETGESLVVDGDKGEIHRLGSREGAGEMKVGDNQVKATSHQPSFYPIATQLLVNLSQVSSLDKVVVPVDGVGLLRSELMMLEALDSKHPSQWLEQGASDELVERLAYSIVQIAAAFAPRPVLYRSLDWRSHEFASLFNTTAEVEVNPMLGRRGTLRYLSDPTYFDLELKALAQVQSYGYTNVRLMLPFVRTVEEFSFCRRRVEQAGLRDNSQFQLWIMAEVPSVLFLLPDYVKAGVQGISIGTNDLTQLLLAVDRDQGNLGVGLDGRHPVVWQAIKQLITMAKTAQIPCSICGQAPAQYPELVDLLVQWGITSISVDGSDLERTYQAIARAEQRLLLEAARHRMVD